MAQIEEDREDLMAEATALKSRAEVLLPSNAVLTFGYRSQGELSLYFGADPVYHFDGHAKLRRAFVDGCLYRTQGQTLAQLTRHRTGPKTELFRADLNDVQLKDFLKVVETRLRQLQQAIQDDAFRVQRVIDPDGNLLPRLTTSIESMLQDGIQLAPRIKGKR